MRVAWLLVLAVACGGAPPAAVPVRPPPKKTEPVARHAMEHASPCPTAATAAVTTVAPLQVLQSRDTNQTQAIAFSASGLLAVLGDDFAIRIWEARSRFLLRTIHVETMPHVPVLSWTGDRLNVLGIASNDEYDLHGARTARVDRALPFPAGVKKPESPYDVGITAAAQSSAAVTLSSERKTAFGELGPASVLYFANRDKPDPGKLITLSGDQNSIALTAGGDFLATTVMKGKSDDDLNGDVYGITLGANVGAPRKIAHVYGWGRAFAVSSDRALVAMGLQRKGARSNVELLVIDAATGKTVWGREPDAEDARGAIADVEEAAFSPQNDLLAVALKDGRVQTYDARSGRYQGALGSKPRPTQHLAFLRDDLLAAVGPADTRATTGHVTTWSTKTGSVVRSTPSPGVQFAGSTADGDVVLAPRFLQSRCGTYGFKVPFGRWEKAVSAGGGSTGIDWSPRCIEGASGIADANLSAGILLLDRNLPPPGSKVFRTDLAIYDMRTQSTVVLADSGKSFAAGNLYGQGLSPDGRWVIEQVSGDDMAWRIWDAKTGAVVRPSFGFVRADKKVQVTTAATLGDVYAFALDKRFSVRDIKTDRELWHLEVDDAITFLTFAKDGRLFVADRSGRMRIVKDGKVLATGTTGGGSISEIVLDPPGKRLATVSSDGAVRLWDAATATVLVALAEFADDEWIAFTPRGAYTGTSEVADRVGWVFDEPLEGFTFDQFSGRFRSENIVTRRLAGDAVDADAQLVRPPRASIASPSESHFTIHAIAADRVDLVRLFVEGRPVAEKAICAAAGDVEIEAPLFTGRNRVTAIAFDSRGAASNAASIDVTSSSPDKPDVWIVAIGVNKYLHFPEQLQLEAADDDARAVAAAFGGMKTFYGQTHVSTLTDDKASPASIRAAIADLQNMKPSDVAVVFFAGHGVKPDAGADMVFVTGGAELAKNGSGLSAESVSRDGIAWKDIAAGLSHARGRVIVMLDACHSGHVSQTLVVQNEELASTLVREERAGAIVLAASKGRQVSLEGGTPRGLTLELDARAQVRASTDEPHGFFTGALLSALASPGADHNGDGALQLSELTDEITLRVLRASKGRQTPWVARRELFGDFAIAPAAKK